MKKLLTFILIFALTIMMCGCSIERLPELSEVSGTVSDNVYVNDYCSLKFAPPSNWVFATDEEIAEIGGSTAKMLEEGGYDGVSPSEIFFDMFAIDVDTGNNVNLSLQIIGNTGKVNWDEIMDENVQDAVNAYGAMGVTNYTISDPETVDLGGIEFHKLDMIAEQNGFVITQAGYIAIVKGVYITLTITVMDDTPVSEIEAIFS